MFDLYYFKFYFKIFDMLKKLEEEYRSTFIEERKKKQDLDTWNPAFDNEWKSTWQNQA